MSEVDIDKFMLQVKMTEETLEEERKKLDLPLVEESGGLFGLGKHKVTGSEYNTLVESINERELYNDKVFVSLQKVSRDNLELFKGLDKYVLQGFEESAKAAKLVSDQALDAAKKAKSAADTANNAIEDIKKEKDRIDELVDSIQDTVIILKRNNDKINETKHFKDIDDIWDSVKELKTDSKELCSRIEAIKHFDQIDVVWDRLDSLEIDKKAGLERIERISKDNNNRYQEIQTCIDELVDKLESCENKLDSHIDEFIKEIDRVNRINDDFSTEIKKNQRVFAVLIICMLIVGIVGWIL